jgi:hypothetical protein
MAESLQQELFGKKGSSNRFLLSATSLGLFSECKRCFWLDKIRGIKRPQGPFPSLPGGMDHVIKIYFDQYRKQDRFPPELEGKLPGRLFPNQELLNGWRKTTSFSRRTGGLWHLNETLGADLVGLLDDCLLEGENHIPLDYKTRGYRPKENSYQYNQLQLDLYTFLLSQNGFKTAQVGYLLYYWPLEMIRDGRVTFGVEPHRVSTEPDRGRRLFEKAAQLLRLSASEGNSPPPSPGCTFCQWSIQAR